MNWINTFNEVGSTSLHSLLDLINFFVGVYSGVYRRPERAMMYQAQQDRIKRFARKFYYIGCYGVAATMSLTSLSYPIRYALFGKPDPSSWKLSIDVE